MLSIRKFMNVVHKEPWSHPEAGLGKSPETEDGRARHAVSHSKSTDCSALSSL